MTSAFVLSSIVLNFGLTLIIASPDTIFKYDTRLTPLGKKEFESLMFEGLTDGNCQGKGETDQDRRKGKGERAKAKGGREARMKDEG